MTFPGEIYRTAGDASAQRSIEVAQRHNGVVVHSTGATCGGLHDAWVVLHPDAPVPEGGVVAFNARDEQLTWSC